MPIAIPNNQPGDPTSDPEGQNPHRGFDFTSAIAGTSIYPLAPGTIYDIIPEDPARHIATIIQDVDFDDNGTPDGVRVEYRHVVTLTGTPPKGDPVSLSKAIAKVASSGRLTIRLKGNTRYGNDLVVTPACFYDGVTAWNDGNDTSFTGQSWYFTNEPERVYLVAYGRDPNTGAIIPPSEVTIFHEKQVEGQYPSFWRESAMTQVPGSNPPTYTFDFLDYRDESGQPYYFPDGQKVRTIKRVSLGNDPDLYRWAFCPASFERPAENPQQWAPYGYVWYYWFMPNLPLDHQWYSQVEAHQTDTRYSWETNRLTDLYYPEIPPPWDNTPFYWHA